MQHKGSYQAYKDSPCIAFPYAACSRRRSFLLDPLLMLLSEYRSTFFLSA